MNALWIAVERDPVTGSITILAFFLTVFATIYAIYFLVGKPYPRKIKE
jgi:hypothetical protein